VAICDLPQLDGLLQGSAVVRSHLIAGGQQSRAVNTPKPVVGHPDLRQIKSMNFFDSVAGKKFPIPSGGERRFRPVGTKNFTFPPWLGGPPPFIVGSFWAPAAPPEFPLGRVALQELAGPTSLVGTCPHIGGCENGGGLDALITIRGRTGEKRDLKCPLHAVHATHLRWLGPPV